MTRGDSLGSGISDKGTASSIASGETDDVNGPVGEVVDGEEGDATDQEILCGQGDQDTYCEGLEPGPPTDDPELNKAIQREIENTDAWVRSRHLHDYEDLLNLSNNVLQDEQNYYREIDILKEFAKTKEGKKYGDLIKRLIEEANERIRTLKRERELRDKQLALFHSDGDKLTDKMKAPLGEIEREINRLQRRGASGRGLMPSLPPGSLPPYSDDWLRQFNIDYTKFKDSKQ